MNQDFGESESNGTITIALILMTRHLLENMLEVHLAFVSAVHHHPADDRSVRVHDEKGEIVIATRIGRKLNSSILGSSSICWNHHILA